MGSIRIDKVGSGGTDTHFLSEDKASTDPRTHTIDDDYTTTGDGTKIDENTSGTGRVIFSASGVTINAMGGADRTIDQWASATLIKELTGQYTLIGAITV